MTEPLIRRDVSDGIATVTLAAPQTLNALSSAMLDALAETFAALATDDSTRVVILTAEGKAFSAGHDLKEMQSYRAATDGGQALTEARQGLTGFPDLCCGEQAAVIKPARQPHPLAMGADGDNLAGLLAGDEQAETIGAQVYRGERRSWLSS